MIRLLKTYKYFFSAISFLLIVVTPFLLKSYSRNLEPYPALLLPSGGEVVLRNKDNFQYQNYYIFCRGDITDKNFRQITLDSFLNPLPMHLKKYAVFNDFGVKNQSDSPIRRKLGWITQKIEYEQRQENLKLWIKSELESLGCEKKILKIGKYQLAMNFNGSKAVEKVLIDEQDITLD